MSLTKCKECENMVSSEAKTCPHCGAKLRKSAWRKLWGIISIILCIVILGLLYQIPSSPVLKPNIEEWIRAEADKYANESFKGTPIVYKRIAGVKKDFPSKGDYTVAVLVDIPDHNDSVLTLEVQKFEDNYTIGWDTRAAAILTLFKMDEEIRQITQ